MPIVTLLNRVKLKRQERRHPFIACNSALRRSYLTGIALLAFADGRLDAKEESLFVEMAQAFDVPESEARAILNRVYESDEDTIADIRDRLIHTKFKYYFVLDLQIMARQDEVVTHEESHVIKRFAEILEMDRDDFIFLKQLASAVLEENPQAKEAWTASFFKNPRLCSETAPEDYRFYMD